MQTPVDVSDRYLARFSMTVPSRWWAWHLGYHDPSSALSRRLFLVVQREIASWLDDRPDAGLTVVSTCSGQGRDLLGVLAGRSDARRIHATLLESDESNVHAARDAIAAVGLGAVRVRQADAGQLRAYRGRCLQTWSSWRGCSETSAGVLFSVGVHRFAGVPEPLGPPARLFTFR